MQFVDQFGASHLREFAEAELLRDLELRRVIKERESERRSRAATRVKTHWWSRRRANGMGAGLQSVAR